MTDPNVVQGTVVSGTRSEGSNTGGNYARLRALAVTVPLGPLMALLVFLLSASGTGRSAVMCVAFASVVAAAARGSRIAFVWARLD